MRISDEDLLRYSKRVSPPSNLEESLYIGLVEKNCSNRTEYKSNFQTLTNLLYDADRRRDVKVVNIIARFLVAYYTKPTLKYGSWLQRKVLSNMVTILLMNGYINLEN